MCDKFSCVLLYMILLEVRSYMAWLVDEAMWQLHGPALRDKCGWQVVRLGGWLVNKDKGAAKQSRGIVGHCGWGWWGAQALAPAGQPKWEVRWPGMADKGNGEVRLGGERSD